MNFAALSMKFVLLLTIVVLFLAIPSWAFVPPQKLYVKLRGIIMKGFT